MKKLIYKYFKRIYKQIAFLVEHDEWLQEKAKFKWIDDSVNIKGPRYIYNHEYITIGKNFRSLHNLRIEAINFYQGQFYTPEITIGENVHFNSDCHIGAIDKVLIGNNVLIASKVFISDHSHGSSDLESLSEAPESRKLTSKGPVIIKDNVWIGEGASILSGVTIGQNSIIGTNSVVIKDVPAFSIVGGVPAKVLKYYNSSILPNSSPNL